MVGFQKIIFLCITFFKVFCDDNFENDFVIVEISLGSVRGVILKSRKGNNIFAFRGIRYAQSPIGNYRFHFPLPVKPWENIFDATKDGWICPQPELFFDKSLMDEDCLILNVYSKNLTKNSPVLVYIHGGGFIFGGSHSKYILGPQYLLDKEIVLVTINYRLGPFGFLSLSNKSVPGNIGFKDQILALKWIQQNIQFFGGNRNLVTLIGESAGSMSVSLHLVSPMSRDLFHNAVMMSGSATAHYTRESLVWSLKLTKILNCPINDSELLLICLRKISWQNITSATNNLLFQQPFLPWMYEIEKDFGQERFLTDDPTKLLINGEFHKIPLIIGSTKDEFAFLASMFGTELIKNFYNLAPKYLMYGYNRTNSSAITKSLQEFYLKNNSTTNVGTLFSDAIIIFGVHRLANYARLHTKVYFYRFDFQGRRSHVYNSVGNPNGVYHADDLQYIFVYDDAAPMFKVTDRENVMVEKLTHWFTTFATTGDPNSNPNEWTNIHWPVSNSTKLWTLYIDEKCYVGDEPYQNRLKLWDELFPIST